MIYNNKLHETDFNLSCLSYVWICWTGIPFVWHGDTRIWGKFLQLLKRVSFSLAKLMRTISFKPSVGSWNNSKFFNKIEKNILCWIWHLNRIEDPLPGPSCTFLNLTLYYIFYTTLTFRSTFKTRPVQISFKIAVRAGL